jgi:transcriptional regulator with XRE-family HTH domain
VAVCEYAYPLLRKFADPRIIEVFHGRQRMSFGETIRNRRKQLSISQKELAARTKKDDGTPISPQYLNDIEQGKRNPDSDTMIEQFAKELDLEKDVLYFWARKIPADLAKLSTPPEKIVRAYLAFRKALKS